MNNYLREVTGGDFSAKDSRTWAGTIQAALTLAEIGPCGSETEGKHNIVEAVRRVAARLGTDPPRAVTITYTRPFSTLTPQAR